jgi:hypothetical protein
MIKKRRIYLPRIVGTKVMMPADLKRLHKYMCEVEYISIVSDEMREVVEEAQREAPAAGVTVRAAGAGIRNAEAYRRNVLSLRSHYKISSLWHFCKTVPRH